MSSVKIPTDVKGLGLSLAMITRAKADESKTSRVFYKDLEKKFLSQAKVEKDFLSHHRWACPPSVDEAILERTNDMHSLNIASKDENNIFLDSASLEALACVAQNIVLFDGPNLRTGYNFVRKLMTDIRLIGSPSANGVVMSASMYDKYKDLVIIKAPQRYDEYTEAAINHELVVGKVLNSIRSVVPNFAFILGAFECGPPVVKPGVGKSEKSKVITWCRGGSKVKYIMYENVSNSKSLYDFCETCSGQDYMDIIIQINYALMMAYRMVGFTHYDLHGENILIKEIKDHREGAYIPYGGDFVYSKYLAMFIDYGYSHVYLPGTDNESVGYKPDSGPKENLYMIQHGTYIDRPSPLADCYRLLEATLSYMKQVNRKAYDEVYGLMYFFHPETENLDVIHKTKDASLLPLYGDGDYNERTARFRYENFIKYCREYCYENDMEDPVVSGKEYTEDLDPAMVFSPSSMNIVKPGGGELDLRIHNIDELFDIVEPLMIYKKYISNDKHFVKEKRVSYEILLDKIYVAVRNQKSVIKKMIHREIRSIQNSLDELPLVNYKNISRSDVHTLRTPFVLKEFLNNFENTVHHLDTMDFIQRRMEMLSFVYKTILGESDEELGSAERYFRTKDDRKIFINFLEKDMKVIADYLDSKGELDKVDERIDAVYENMLAVIPE